MKLSKIKKVISAHPIISFLMLTAFIVVFSSILFVFNVGSTYQLISSVSKDYTPITESVIPLFNLSGLKYIFTNSVTNFANYPAFINLIIILIGIGVLDKSGFLQAFVTLTTRKTKKTTVTFVIILICLLSSIIGDLSYLIFLPLFSLFFNYAKRSPLLGIVITYASLAIGSSLSVVFTAVDSALSQVTILNAGVLQNDYSIKITSLLFINLLVILLIAYVFTKITETYVVKKLPKYEFPDSLMEESVLTKKQMRGLLCSAIIGVIYVIIVAYNIIPGLPLSGNLLDYSQKLYIDKLFSVDSFFSNGFVFIITFFFILIGLVYGVFAKTIKSDKDFINSLGHSLDGIGKTILMIFVASICISVLHISNIGDTLTTLLTSLSNNLNFISLPLVLLLLFVSMIATILVPTSLDKWGILSSTFVPSFMNAGLTPEFAQLVFRLGEAVTMCITPFLVYFVIYLAYLQKYSSDDNNIGIMESIKFQIPYALVTFVIVITVLVLFFVTNIPLGIAGSVSL